MAYPARHVKSALLVAATLGVAVEMSVPVAYASTGNERLNFSVVSNVYTIQQQSGCPQREPSALKVNPQLRLAAERHTDDVMNNRALDGDVGSDGSTPQDRANATGYHGKVSETVAINPAVAISGVEIMKQWYYNPAYFAIMSNCATADIGVWSENSLDRTVVVAVYGQPQ